MTAHLGGRRQEASSCSRLQRTLVATLRVEANVPAWALDSHTTEAYGCRSTRAGRPRGAPVRYEPPRIVRRERIDGLLSDGFVSVGFSDVNLKENIVSVVW
jgi:hypothetical protein